MSRVRISSPAPHSPPPRRGFFHGLHANGPPLIWRSGGRLFFVAISPRLPANAVVSDESEQPPRFTGGCSRWCRERDLNPHASRRPILSRMRLPFRHPGARLGKPAQYRRNPRRMGGDLWWRWAESNRRPRVRSACVYVCIPQFDCRAGGDWWARLPFALFPLSFASRYGTSRWLAFFWFSSRGAKGRASRSLSHLSSESVVLVAS